VSIRGWCSTWSSQLMITGQRMELSWQQSELIWA
jgi:hypothetical protein